MSRIFKRFQDEDDEFTDEEIAAATMIVESGGKKVVEDDYGAFYADTCFICRASGKEGSHDQIKANTGVYTLYVCNDCRKSFRS